MKTPKRSIINIKLERSDNGKMIYDIKNLIFCSFSKKLRKGKIKEDAQQKNQLKQLKKKKRKNLNQEKYLGFYIM